MWNLQKWCSSQLLSRKNTFICSKLYSNMWIHLESTYILHRILNCIFNDNYTHSYSSIRDYNMLQQETEQPARSGVSDNAFQNLPLMQIKSIHLCALGTVKMHIRHNKRFPVWKISDHSDQTEELRYDCLVYSDQS